MPPHYDAEQNHDTISPKIRELAESTAKNKPSKRKFCQKVENLNIQGITPALGGILFSDIKKHFNEPKLTRTELLYSSIQEKLIEWGVCHTSKNKSAPQTLNKNHENKLPSKLLKKLSRFRLQDDLVTLLNPESRDNQTSNEELNLQKWQKILHDATFSFDALSNIVSKVAYRERNYNPDCFLHEIEDFFLKTLASQAILIHPQLIHAIKNGFDFADCLLLPTPYSTESSFESIKTISKLANHNRPTSINLSKLPPSSDHIDSQSLSGEVIPFISALINSSRHRIPLRACLSINHPDILSFLDLAQQMALIGIKPTIALNAPFFDALKNPSDWTLFFGGKTSNKIDIGKILEKLIQLIQESNCLEFYSNQNKHELIPDFDGTLLPTGSQSITGYLNLSEICLNLDPWQKIKDLSGNLCHFLDNAKSNNNSSLIFVIKLIGIKSWIEALYNSSDSAKVSEQINRLVEFTIQSLEEISSRMAKERGGLSGRRFEFVLATNQESLIDEVFHTQSDLPQNYVYGTPVFQNFRPVITLPKDNKSVILQSLIKISDWQCGHFKFS